MKALYAIFNVVTPSEFKQISICKSARDTWEILKITHKGTQTIKDPKLQTLTSKFKECIMKESETVDQFYARLRNIENGTFSLGETISDAKIVRKVLRSLRAF